MTNGGLRVLIILVLVWELLHVLYPEHDEDKNAFQ